MLITFFLIERALSATFSVKKVRHSNVIKAYLNDYFLKAVSSLAITDSASTRRAPYKFTKHISLLRYRCMHSWCSSERTLQCEA